jgi:hypothetical protein
MGDTYFRPDFHKCSVCGWFGGVGVCNVDNSLCIILTKTTELGVKATNALPPKHLPAGFAYQLHLTLIYHGMYYTCYL